MKHKLLLIFAFILAAKLSHSQIIDRYGINTGLSYSTQIWDDKLVSEESGNKYKFGFQAFLQAEKDFGSFLALRTELGYIQKGFKNNSMELKFSDGTTAELINENAVLHDLALNIGLKVKPLKSDFSPYLLAGLRGDYMIFNSNIVYREPASGMTFNVFEPEFKEFNKFNLGGLIGVGIDIKDLIYFEVEYNPNFTKNLDTKGLSVKDNCWGAKIGLNINKLIK